MNLGHYTPSVLDWSLTGSNLSEAYTLSSETDPQFTIQRNREQSENGKSSKREEKLKSGKVGER
uniref:Uncharacterized protein n=1 Tax=Megaselia scalaris TaxID=36166 RepID=T1GJJ2_MEGSC